jgi:hypothetical protein
MNLNKLYRHYNRECFGGELPIVPVRWGKLNRAVVGRTHFTANFKPLYIMIRKEYRPFIHSGYVKIILLHEMVHVMCRGMDCDTREFKEEMLRVLKAAPDLNIL